VNVLLNRAFQMPADGWFQIVPIGEFRLRLNRKTDGPLVSTLENRGVVFPASNGDRVSVLQVVDAESVQAMANAFRAEAAAPNFAGMLIDSDHLSDLQDQPTAARGWITNLEPRPDGLYGRIRFVDETDVTTGRYRFLSPVFDPLDVVPLGANRVRPVRLEMAAMTNRPNMRTIKPLSNRETEPQQTLDNREESIMDHKKELLALLGLNADATDEAISSAQTALANRLTAADALQAQLDAAKTESATFKNRAEQAEGELATLRRQDLERLVEADLTEFAGVIANRDEAKAQLLANRDGARKLLAALKAKADTPREPLRNRANAQTPPPPSEQTTPGDKARRRGALINRMRVEKALTDFDQARAAAVQADPELFKD